MLEHVRCPRCSGTGRLLDPNGIFYECPACNGTGLRQEH